MRKPILVTSFNGDKKGVDLAIPATDCQIALEEIVDSIETPDWFNHWDDVMIQALYRGTITDHKYSDKILQYGQQLSALIKNCYRRVAGAMLEELNRQAKALSEKLSMRNDVVLTNEIVFTFWITQLIWRKLYRTLRQTTCIWFQKRLVTELRY